MYRQQPGHVENENHENKTAGIWNEHGHTLSNLGFPTTHCHHGVLSAPLPAWPPRLGDHATFPTWQMWLRDYLHLCQAVVSSTEQQHSDDQTAMEAPRGDWFHQLQNQPNARMLAWHVAKDKKRKRRYMGSWVVLDNFDSSTWCQLYKLQNKVTCMTCSFDYNAFCSLKHKIMVHV